MPESYEETVTAAQRNTPEGEAIMVTMNTRGWAKNGVCSWGLMTIKIAFL